MLLINDDYPSMFCGVYPFARNDHEIFEHYLNFIHCLEQINIKFIGYTRHPKKHVRQTAFTDLLSFQNWFSEYRTCQTIQEFELEVDLGEFDAKVQFNQMPKKKNESQGSILWRIDVSQNNFSKYWLPKLYKSNILQFIDFLTAIIESIPTKGFGFFFNTYMVSDEDMILPNEMDFYAWLPQIYPINFYSFEYRRNINLNQKKLFSESYDFIIELENGILFIPKYDYLSHDEEFNPYLVQLMGFLKS